MSNNNYNRQWVSEFNQRFPQTDESWVREGNTRIFVKDWRTWQAPSGRNRGDLQYVDVPKLQELLIFAAAAKANDPYAYNTLAQVTPPSFGSTSNFIDAIEREWTLHRGYRVPEELRRGPRPRTEQPAPDGSGDIFNTPSPAANSGLFNLSGLTRDARPDRDNDLVSPNVLARADRAVRDLKSSVVLAA